MIILVAADWNSWEFRIALLIMIEVAVNEICSDFQGLKLIH